jgi:hypothetical protein
MGTDSDLPNDTPTNSPTDTLITSRAEYHTALRAAFSEIAVSKSAHVWLCDEDFAEWPLGERAVVDQLAQWAATSRKLTLVARHFDEVARRHPRWVAWRRDWSHIVTCRTNKELGTGEFPSLLVASGAVCVRLADNVHHRGRLSHTKADELRCMEQFDAILQRSEEAFPASTTGL